MIGRRPGAGSRHRQRHGRTALLSWVATKASGAATGATTRAAPGQKPGHGAGVSRMDEALVCSSDADVVSKLLLARAGQFAHHAAAAGDGHQQRLGRAAHFRARSGGNRRSVATSRTPRMRHNPPMSGAITAVRSAGSSRSGGMARGRPKRAPDVLVMDECLDQCDPSAQRCGQPPRLQVICQQGQQLLRAARIASRQGGDGDLAGTEPAPGHMRYQAVRVELVVADDVGNHISDPPPRAPRRRLPLQRRQRREERGEVRPFVSRQTSHVQIRRAGSAERCAGGQATAAHGPAGRLTPYGARGGPCHTEDVGLYADQILPRAINLALRGGEFEGPRARAAAGLDGEVLEIGFGSGLNIPHYPAGLKRVRAVEPATAGRKLAARRAAACAVPIEYAGSDATALPVPDESVDHVLSTWTLCTIPDAMRALAEVRRVLRPGGAFRFVEHGLAPDPGVARLQQRLTPLQRRAFGGCHLNRRIDHLVAAAGLELTRMDTYYMKGPRALGYTFEGVAIRP